MNKVIRKVSLASLLLLLSAVGSCYVGNRQWQNEEQQFEKYMEAHGFYISDVSPDTNFWQIAGVLLFFVSAAVGIAAFMLWRQDRYESR